MATEYRLSLAKTNAALTAHWDLDGAATTSLAITPTLTPADLAEHRWYLEEYILFPGPGDHARARAFEQRLEAFGRDLHRALYHDGRDLLGDLVQASGPRLLTLTSQDPEALSLPWELLRDPKSALVFQEVVLRRALPVRAAPKVTPVPALPLRILLVIARPTDAGQIDARSSAAPMLAALDALGGRVHVELHDLPDIYKVYANLEDLAIARNRPEEAAAWRAKKEAKLAHLDRLAHGDGPPRLPPQHRQAFNGLCNILHAALSSNQPIPPDTANALARLATQPDPLGAAGRFLQRIAAGDHPDPPDGLPPELTEIFAALVSALRSS